GVSTKKGTFRKLEELNLLDDFLFQEIASSPEVGEEFCRILLRVVLGKEVRKVKVIPQRAIQGVDVKQHGIRLDAYIEDVSRDEIMGEMEMFDAQVMPENSDIYDIEPNKIYEKERLPRKMRYYHGLIDTKLLKTSVNYEKLPNVFIIMILPYDPFGNKRMVYTIKNQCVEDKTVSYEDGAVKLFLYTRGTEGKPSQDLIDMLKYIEESTDENVKNQDIKRVDELVRHIKESEEVGIRHMKSWEWEEYIKRNASEEGLAQGLEKGMERAENRCIVNMHKNGYTLKQIAEVMEKSEEEIQAVVKRELSVLL
ncbi:MAG: Rpn family recombination-promoting nuclease/putative transposase, partial [Lachnospiraceae bacterium]|nr:Rpn family recombination-promoting nuclease/putative transposase [Lachnospiraceae bacterium]